jgi:hypothetical protein
MSGVLYDAPSVRTSSDPPPNSLAGVAVAFDYRHCLQEPILSPIWSPALEACRPYSNHPKARPQADRAANGCDIRVAQFQGRTYSVTTDVLPRRAIAVRGLGPCPQPRGEHKGGGKQSNRRLHPGGTTRTPNGSRSVERLRVQRRRASAVRCNAWFGSRPSLGQERHRVDVIAGKLR